MHEAEFDQEGWEEKIWEKVLEEFGVYKVKGNYLYLIPPDEKKMRLRFQQLKEELSS